MAACRKEEVHMPTIMIPARIVAVGVSEIEGKPEDFELLLSLDDGREIGFDISKTAFRESLGVLSDLENAPLPDAPATFTTKKQLAAFERGQDSGVLAVMEHLQKLGYE